jgi:hypothetical protein
MTSFPIVTYGLESLERRFPQQVARTEPREGSTMGGWVAAEWSMCGPPLILR